jgi:hypothetical protein
MTSADPGTTMRAGRLYAGLQVKDSNRRVVEVDVLNADIQKFTDSAS